MSTTSSAKEASALIRAIENALSQYHVLASKAMAKCLEAVKEKVEPYPPQPDRMRSGHLNTYVRGKGFYPKSAFVADATQPGGYRIKRIKRERIRFTSEQLDKSFKMEVRPAASEIIGRLYNSASYSGYVIGSKTEKPKQTEFHAKTGWMNKEDALQQAKPQIDSYVKSSISEFMTKLKG